MNGTGSNISVKQTHWHSPYVLSNKYDISQLTKNQVRSTGNVDFVTEYDLFYLYPQERSIFSAVYILIYIIAVFGNIAAIVVTTRRKQRYIQKTCIISLALSDFITATGIAVMYLNVFSQPIIVWTWVFKNSWCLFTAFTPLGPFMCSFLPCVPLFGVVCSSAALAGIALDRYRNVVHALQKRWNPSLLYCLICATLLWIFSTGISSPMFIFFTSNPVNVIYFDHTHLIPLYFEREYMCITLQKHNLQIYYICLLIIVFLPLLLIFLWLYIEIAKLIWKHRKPLSSIFNKKTETSTTAETSTSQTRISEDCSRTTTNSDLNLKAVIKNRNTRAARKIRTFKIIVFLMCAFLVLRLPGLLFDTIKLTIMMDQYLAWIIKYSCTALILLNCALNPFLYTFLNKTLDISTRIIRTLKEFVCEVCCCCFSTTEFQEFENENPFIPQPFENEHGSDSPLSKKSNPKSSRVKFEELPAVKLYSPEVNTSQESYKEIKKY